MTKYLLRFLPKLIDIFDLFPLHSSGENLTHNILHDWNFDPRLFMMMLFEVACY